MQQINLPQIDKLIRRAEFNGLLRAKILQIAKNIVAKQREMALLGKTVLSEDEIVEKILQEYEKFQNLSFKPLINATGVVLHTNLGRSVTSPEILKRATPLITSYSNLEFDLQSGKRGDRYAYIGDLCATLFGCEDALVVNNNAAAVFLILNTFAKNKEVIVSRGELVEIGGSFRISEVMQNSGAILREVGTTNKTKISDYKNAINENTAILMKVHRSNFEISGFTQSVEIDELSHLAKFANEKKSKFFKPSIQENFSLNENFSDDEIIDYYDLGSGYVANLPTFLSKNEPSVSKILSKGARLVSFSGDKLFGSVQAGIILGEKKLIDKLRKNQLLRMLRVGKVTLAILSETLLAYIQNQNALITTNSLINRDLSELENLALNVASKIKFKTQIVKTTVFLGGGAMPLKSYPSIALAILNDEKPQITEIKFRKAGIIGRIENGKFLLDFRCILDTQKLIQQIGKIL